jgi:hypothetical protein
MVTGGFMAMAGFVSLANATSTALLVIALSIGYIALGWRLHSGRRLARTSGWLSVPASLAAGAFTAIATYRSGQFSWWLPALFALNFAWLAAITVLALLSRTSVTWYIRMAAERRVFDAERTGVVEVV